MDAFTLNPVLKIKDSVDVYVSMTETDVCTIQFYHINTRQKLSIQIDPAFSELLSVFDGIHSLSTHLERLDFELDADELKSTLQYLIDNGVLEHPSHIDQNSRYSRQINFLSDWIFGVPAEVAHKRILDTHCVIFGIGAIGSSIAISLARAGVSKLTLVDNKKLEQHSSERHPYFSKSELGQPKVHALKRYLLRINSEIDVIGIQDKLLPLTDLSGLVDDASLVVNTADEPYIGHTSAKLGRYLWRKNIPLYVAGGFDAHLMSTGDFYIPGESNCVDCSTNFFTVALADWKPSYKIHESSITKTHVIGGSGGLYSMSLFSASYGCVQLLNYIAGGNAYKSRLSKRGEFMTGKGEIEWIEIPARDVCDVCGK
ncbi:ThiF family adenylyltransferase [Pseudomonas khavaziana]|uniref:ThiF family adenylyltransferase n=1 Tax=Pseudomonas khavaziana TaxID=2842351 RepID=UPI001C3DF070|nr:ThiF family adenylyltransferase [Pseudomonas khavaziana]MBV4480007.1 ThiF family adenylyltransferase [Pseudomonas khavaziana]